MTEKFSANKYCYNKMLWLTPNKFFADTLQYLYAGESGEVIAFLQLSYQSFMLLPYGEEIGKTFEQIANEDLLHAKNIAETIVMLGGKPDYKIPSGKFLGGRSICSDNNISSMLVADIELKEKSIISTKNAISKINNNVIKNMLEKIILDEELHINLLKNIQEKIKK